MENKNYEYFENNIDDLLKLYRNKFIVIKESKVIASYDIFDKAYTETIKTQKLGTFLIQRCIPIEDSTIHFASNNVSFAGISK